MKKITTRLSLLALLVLVGVGCSHADTTNVAMEKTETENTEVVGNRVVENKNTSKEIMEEKGQYVAYDASEVATAATKGDAVLFFHAPWCPTCKALNDDIEASLDDIPSGLTIFKTDYDTQTELKKKYGVTYQHTLVQVDAEGNVITKWSGGNTLEELLSHVE